MSAERSPLMLSVNIDHIATLRQARGAPYPDPVDAARLAEQAGAGGITVHLRSDRRHIQDDDVRRLRRMVQGKLNLEIATTEEMLAFAVDIGPQQVTLVPERPDEVTTEGGLDVIRRPDLTRQAAKRLSAAGISVSVFLDPQMEQLKALAALDRDIVPGFEINTDALTKATLEDDASHLRLCLQEVIDVARRGVDLGFKVYAGHGLTTHNVGLVAAIEEVEELNIGHWLVSRASLIGLQAAIDEMLAAMERGRQG